MKKEINPKAFHQRMIDRIPKTDESIYLFGMCIVLSVLIIGIGVLKNNTPCLNAGVSLATMTVGGILARLKSGEIK